MGWGRPDPYYNPGDFGLEIVDSIDSNYDSYGFDMFILWKHTESGKFYIGTDSGCSCPSPFEDVHSLDSLTEVDSFSNFEWYLNEWLGDSLEWHDHKNDLHHYVDNLKKLAREAGLN